MRKFIAKNKVEILLRVPKKSDAHAYLSFVNGLVEENAPINLRKKQTLKEVKHSISYRISRSQNRNNFVYVAEKDSEIAAICEVKRRVGRMLHVGDFGIAVCKKYRGIGVGEAISKEVLREAKEGGIEIVRLETFVDNEPAKSLYRKLGFVEETVLKGEILDENGYRDAVLMSLYFK